MNPWVVLAAIVAVALAYVLLPVVLEAFLRFRTKRQLPCPEIGTTAEVGLDARWAAFTSAFRSPLLRVKSCSLWPEKGRCEQDCVAPLEEEAPGPRRS